MEDKKIRVLALCDTPTGATGFSQVSKNVLKRLADTGLYEIDVIGINYKGDYYDRSLFPYNIYPACPQGYQDMYGRGRLLNALNGVEEQVGLIPGWDIIFTIQDPFIIEGLGLTFPFAEQLKVSSALWKRTVEPERWFKWIGYFPVDANVKENWVTRSIALCDKPVAYCDWGLKQIMEFDRHEYQTIFKLNTTDDAQKRNARIMTPSLRDRIQVIHHGIDTTKFFPIDEKEKQEFRKEYFKGVVKDDTFLVINVSRNQPRKDLTRTLAAFAKFKEYVPNSFLYLHSRADDLGGSIHEMARNFNLVENEDYGVPMKFNEGIGIPVEVVNKIYNCADLCVTTTLGEGWGFITSEAMATKTPIVAPNITSIIDIFNSGDFDYSQEMLESSDKLRGIPCKAGSTSSEWVCLGLEDNERIRPLTNVDDMVSKMVWVYKNKDNKKLDTIVERGYEWITKHTWDDICQQWNELFLNTYNELKIEREVGAKIDSTGRNEPCPCNSGKKFKNCHGSSDKLAKYQDWIME